MELLNVDGVTYRLGERDVLGDISFVLRSGQRLGLVGRNGAGKSTLLNLLAGQLKPDEGRVLRVPGVRLGFQTPLTEGTVQQAGQRALAHVQGLEAALRAAERRLSIVEANSEQQARTLQEYADLTERFEAAGGYEAEVKLERILTAFGFGTAEGSRLVTTLSGGERSRLTLALALVDQPDVLLLDEPSSHLDLSTRRILTERLKAYPGALLFASHDRALLDDVCTHIGQLEAAHFTLHKGSYSSFRQKQGLVLRTAQRRAKEREKEVAALSASAARLRGWGTPTAARQRRNIEKRLGRLEEVTPLRNTSSKDLLLETQNVSKRSGMLLEAQHLSKKYEEVIIEDTFLRIEAGDKLALVGPNGTGKSTLLKMLTGELESDHPEAALHFGKRTKVAVFDQKTRGLEAGVPLVDQLARYVSEPRARMLLALVGLPEKADALPETLSEGQKARAGTALIMASEANLLILDEPTENMDIEMIERLENALQDTEAAFVLVSHDATLVARVATRVVSLEGGGLKEFRGGLKGYFKGTLRLEPNLPEAVEPVQEESVEARLERLELERLELEEARLTSYRLTERERLRLERRYADLLNDLSQLYEARHFISTPLHHKREGTVEVWVDDTAGHYLFTSNAGLRVRLFENSSSKSRLGHLALSQVEGQCTLSWTKDAVLRLVAQTAFEHLGFHALQLQSNQPLRSAGFEEAGADWWVLSRRRYEGLQGYSR